MLSVEGPCFEKKKSHDKDPGKQKKKRTPLVFFWGYEHVHVRSAEKTFEKHDTN